MTSTAEGKSEALERYPLPESASPVLGYAGSFEHRKGLPVLLEAVKILASGAAPNVHLMLVGDGPDEDLLKDMVQNMDLGANVTFFPFTREPNYIFERVDITVLSSLYKEGLPNILLESMSMQVPVVSSDLGGVKEIVIDGDTGYSFEPGDHEQLAFAIEQLWKDKAAYQQMRLNARDLMVKDFDKEIQFGRFLQYFDSLIARRPKED
jgi:glycosyltransferase involved in cell wall biosynthesis